MNSNTCSLLLTNDLIKETKGLFSDLSLIELRDHLTTHKYFLGLKKGYSPSWKETINDYNINIYTPITKLIYNWNFDISFPKTKKEVLYFQFTKHLYYLRLENPKVSIYEASIDFCHKYGNNKKGKMLVNLIDKIK